MARAGSYVEKYQQDFSPFLAGERYVQEVRDAAERRVLISEFALVRVEDADCTLWLAFRDVVEVDGRAARDREERLRRLFITPPANVLAQARAIAIESARYNIGEMTRTVNVPTLALESLETRRRNDRASGSPERTRPRACARGSCRSIGIKWRPGRTARQEAAEAMRPGSSPCAAGALLLGDAHQAVPPGPARVLGIPRDAHDREQDVGAQIEPFLKHG
jgi:hypothetical protein